LHDDIWWRKGEVRRREAERRRRPEGGGERDGDRRAEWWAADGWLETSSENHILKGHRLKALQDRSRKGGGEKRSD
jgi:hypothetical protein